jgi:hypothetical protein
MKAETILKVKTWKVEVFNDGHHLRINGVVDVWPAKRRWMPTNSGKKTQQFADVLQLAKFVKQVEAESAKPKPKPAKREAPVPKPAREHARSIEQLQAAAAKFWVEDAKFRPRW